MSMQERTADFSPVMRNAVRAVIFRDGMLLVQRKVYENGEVCFTLPGGGAEVGETLEDGLRRECVEEIGADVEVRDLVHVADYFKQRDTLPATRRHQIEFLFLCDVPDDYVAANGRSPDKHQQDVTWLDLASESADLLWPQSLQQILKRDTEASDAPTYLGLID
ncbi:hydrolase, NUDIX family [Rhodopirellula sallentina SM41]|uniref:Hydrolase, NUDIX family n=2 Tax=Rhodopirellula TaxID=265488 RepID=M5U4A4_9BACT|nr:hydrolase, NUDIX family [Rhodopirellula sallentina SM41]